MRLIPALLLLAAACGHSEPYTTAPTQNDGPFSAGAPTRLTFGSSTDSAAALTSDGQGVLYFFTGFTNGDRCIGLLPPGGGTRRWELCDTRFEAADSGKSYSAPALNSDGQLLYISALARRGRDAPDRTTLWLADSALPFQRRALISFPINVGGQGVSWLSDAQWTGPESFIARAGLLNVQRACPNCTLDTTVVPAGVVRGTITPTGATLSFVPGAESPEVMALAENGGVIVFMRSFTEVLRVPATGGTPTLVAALPTSARVTGISCRGSECVLTQLGGTVAGGGEGTRIYRIRLATNAVDLLTTVAGRWAGPVLLPTGGDVVMQASTTPTRDLYLFKGLLP
ncbi:MAG: hypothetical protein SFU84_02895 [Gemmatimonadales bacterium]|nr:hypothetical protein [Gemmatimonadales bacterium]